MQPFRNVTRASLQDIRYSQHFSGSFTDIFTKADGFVASKKRVRLWLRTERVIGAPKERRHRTALLAVSNTRLCRWQTLNRSLEEGRQFPAHSSASRNQFRHGYFYLRHDRKSYANVGFAIIGFASFSTRLRTALLGLGTRRFLLARRLWSGESAEC